MYLEGMQDVQLVEGKVNKEKFEDFVIIFWIHFNENNNQSVVIMDNCTIHHLDQVVNLIETRAKAKAVFPLPYSSDLMPLE